MKNSDRSIKKIECVCFDMDGTLIRSTDSVRFLCELNDNLDALGEIEGFEYSGKVSWIEADHLKARLIEGLELDRVESEFWSSVELIQNIEQVLAYLKERRIRTVLITAGPTQVADLLGIEFGFDGIYGSRYEVIGGRFTGRITHHLGTVGKLSCLRDFCEENDIALSRCVAVGDSESDLELFKKCGKSIAINADDKVTKKASESVVTENLADILDILESWLGE